METATPTPGPAAVPAVLSPAEAESLLHKNVARLRDQFIHNVEHCTFVYAYAGLPAEYNNEEGWTFERQIVMRDGRLDRSSGGGGRTPNRQDAGRMPESDDGSNPFDNAHDLIVWFGSEYLRFVNDAPRGTYLGRSTYLGQPSLRYETRIEREDALESDVPTSALIVTDYLVENPYVFVENEYSVLEDGARRLERQFMRYRYELTRCTAGEKRDAAAVAVWDQLAERAADVYSSLREGLLDGCRMTFKVHVVQWLHPWWGKAFPGGPVEGEGSYAVARDAEGLWRATSESVTTQRGRVVYGVRATPDGIWELDTQTGEWTELPDADNPGYEDLSEALGEYLPIGNSRFVDSEGSPVSSDHGQHYGRYAGKVAVDGRDAARYELLWGAHSQVIDVNDGLKMRLVVREFFEDNPLLSRVSSHYLLPGGELQPSEESTIDELGLEDCPV